MVSADKNPDRLLKIVPGRPIQFRATVRTHEKLVGSRITIPLSTRDIEQARRIRDMLEELLQTTDPQEARRIKRSVQKLIPRLQQPDA